MTHLTEEQLVLHYYGEDSGDPGIERHLTDCQECRNDYNVLQLVLNTMDSAAVPERAPDYGTQVWRRILPSIGKRHGWRWLFEQRWLILIPTTAFLMALAFLAGRVSKPDATTTASTQVRERILLVAVGDHLDRSQMVLAELSNAPDGKGKIDISGEQQLAEDLLDDNRLYRQTAHTTGDTAVASVLDELERVLLEIAHSPSEVSSDQLNQLRKEIQDRGLLFKVRVVGSQVRQREIAPSQSGKEGKKV